MCIRDSYKVARGDEVIPIIGESYQNVSFIEHVLEESHGFWKDLVTGKEDPGSINFNQTSNWELELSLIHIFEPTRHLRISYAVFCLKKNIHSQSTQSTSHRSHHS